MICRNSRSATLLAASLLCGAAAADEPATAPTPFLTTVKVSGQLQIQAEAGDRGDARFPDGHARVYVRRGRLTVSGLVLPEVEYKLDVETANSIGAVNGLKAQLLDGYVGARLLGPALRLRVGQFKAPFGFEQLALDQFLFSIERSLASDRLAAPRQLGIQASGDLPGERLSWAAGVFEGLGPNVNVNDDGRFFRAARLSGVPFAGRWLGRDLRLSAGVDGFASGDRDLSVPAEFGFTRNVFAGRRDGFGLDAQLRWGPAELWAEYLAERFRPDDAVPAREVTADGWYAQATAFVLPGRLQALAKYESYRPDRSRRATETWTLGGNWLVKGDALKLQVDCLSVAAPEVASRQTKWIARVQALF